MVRFRLVTLAVLSSCIFLVGTSSYAAGLDEKYKGSGLEKNEEINNAHKTILGLEIGVSSLKDVLKTFGDAAVHVSDDRHEPDTLCYVSRSDNDDTVVVIESGPRCGPSREFVGFVVAARDAVDSGKIGECLPSATVDRNISTESGVKLGISPDRLIELIGVPSRIDGDVFIYHYDFEKHLTHVEIETADGTQDDSVTYLDFYLYAQVEAEFSNEKLVRFSVFEIYE